MCKSDENHTVLEETQRKLRMWGKIEVGYRMYEANYVKSRNKVKI